MTVVTLYGKAGCCLCDEARAAIAAVRAEPPVRAAGGGRLARPRAERPYGERIPVVEVDGEEAFELGVDAAGAARTCSIAVHP